MASIGSRARGGFARGVLALSALGLASACEREVILTGERFDVRAPLEASIPVEGQPAPRDTTGVIANRSVPVALPGVQPNAPWTQRAGTARHVPPHGALRAQPVLAFATSIGSGNGRRNRITASPVVADGRVIAMDATTHLTAVSTGGAALWSVSLMPPGARGDISGGGIAYGDGRVYVSTGHGELLAVNPANGAVIWRQALDAPASGAPATEGGVVYVSGRDGAAWAVDGRNGRVLWQFPGLPATSGALGTAAPGIADGTVLFPFASGEIVAAKASDGVPVWSASVSGERLGRGTGPISDITGDPVIVGGTAYAANVGGRTAAISMRDGSRIWTADEGAQGPVLVLGNALFLVTDQGRLVRLDAGSGQPVWAVDMPNYVSARPGRRSRIYANFGPVLAGGRLAVASGDGTLRLFDPASGTLVGSVEIPGGAASAPALSGGALYVVSNRGQLLAFR